MHHFPSNKRFLFIWRVLNLKIDSFVYFACGERRWIIEWPCLSNNWIFQYVIVSLLFFVYISTFVYSGYKSLYTYGGNVKPEIPFRITIEVLFNFSYVFRIFSNSVKQNSIFLFFIFFITKMELCALNFYW